MTGWYNTATNLPPPTARVTLAQVTEEREFLYRRVTPLTRGYYTSGGCPFTDL